MSELTASDFGAFFREIHGFAPFPWQERLAADVCGSGKWPGVVDLPTASGKTACIDIALFAFAVRDGDAPRRMFFVVDRRVIADEADHRARTIAAKLKSPEPGGAAEEVAQRLRELGGEADCPLRTTVLRGGTYRDESWLESPAQPTVIASTVDQVGSRLLFRGYGMRAGAWPLHAGMIGNDALIFLDEAHCSFAFAKTLERVERFRGEDWAETPIGKPFHFVEMTATPAGEGKERFRISDADRENEVFRKRLTATKPVRLVQMAGKAHDAEKLAERLISEAQTLAREVDGKRVAIMVNRIETAKVVFRRLGTEAATLVIGRMRPVDRERVNKALQPVKAGVKRDGELRYVVATQCLEVGADLDFDVVVSECASIDALIQRFGRLDRLGEWGKASGAIVVGDWQLKADKPDAIYGTALKATWEWLGKQAVDGVVQMGVEGKGGVATIAERFREEAPKDQDELKIEQGRWAALLPGHLDCLVQTQPTPRIEPEVEVFLHGERSGAADVQVVWRGDLDEEGEDWGRILDVCPPCSGEAMPAQFVKVQRWLSDRKVEASGDGAAAEGDIEGSADSSGEEDRDRRRRSKRPTVVAFIWREGKEWTRLNWARELRPGDTVVLRQQDGGWDDFGHVPADERRDVGDEARVVLRKRVYLRLHPTLIEQSWPACEERTALIKLVMRDDVEPDELETALRDYPKESLRTEYDQIRADLLLNGTADWEKHPSGKGYILSGWIGGAKRKAGKATTLKEHSGDVVARGERDVERLLEEASLRDAIQNACQWHDAGKADVRFQAWLRGGDLLAAQLAKQPLAKSGRLGLRDQSKVGLPRGFRHELLSLLFAEKRFGEGSVERDLILHLIASHHGGCRPFAPVVVERDPKLVGCVEYEGVQLCREERLGRAPHVLDSGVAERFWSLTRRFGWWGLAYLESLVRLADWKASSEEHQEATE